MLTRLPYRWRVQVDQWRIERALRRLDATAPLHAAPPDLADAEVHMLVCARDASVGLLAIKSLLRFQQAAWAVTFSDDGTLTPAQRARYERHVPGARWVRWPAPEADTPTNLAPYPRLRALYHSAYPPAAKLLHPFLLGRHARVVLMDSDTAFSQAPQRLLAWVRGQDHQPLYLHEHQDEAVVVPAPVQARFAELAAHLGKEGQAWRLGHRLFNSGLLVFRPDQLHLHDAERYLAWHATLPPDKCTGKAAIWFGPWTPEQTCYHVMYALCEPPAQPLGSDYHLGGGTGHVFNHFLRHYLRQTPTLRHLEQLVAQLPRR